jgi:poly(A) polymerase
VTTQNRRRAQALQQAMDELEARLERLGRAEELAAIRPPLVGHPIMRHRGIAPGPMVGRAYRHLLEARIARGPMTVEEGHAELDAWVTEQED